MKFLHMQIRTLGDLEFMAISSRQLETRENRSDIIEELYANAAASVTAERKEDSPFGLQWPK